MAVADKLDLLDDLKFTDEAEVIAHLLKAPPLSPEARADVAAEAAALVEGARAGARHEGVVESFVGLLHLTWSALDAEHDLNKKFGFDSDAFLSQVAKHLGDNRSLPELLATCAGGALEVLRPEAAG